MKSSRELKIENSEILNLKTKLLISTTPIGWDTPEVFKIVKIAKLVSERWMFFKIMKHMYFQSHHSQTNRLAPKVQTRVENTTCRKWYHQILIVTECCFRLLQNQKNQNEVWRERQEKSNELHPKSDFEPFWRGTHFSLNSPKVKDLLHVMLRDITKLNSTFIISHVYAWSSGSLTSSLLVSGVCMLLDSLQSEEWKNFTFSRREDENSKFRTKLRNDSVWDMEYFGFWCEQISVVYNFREKKRNIEENSLFQVGHSKNKNSRCRRRLVTIFSSVYLSAFRRF